MSEDTAILLDRRDGLKAAVDGLVRLLRKSKTQREGWVIYNKLVRATQDLNRFDDQYPIIRGL